MERDIVAERWKSTWCPGHYKVPRPTQNKSEPRTPRRPLSGWPEAAPSQGARPAAPVCALRPRPVPSGALGELRGRPAEFRRWVSAWPAPPRLFTGCDLSLNLNFLILIPIGNAELSPAGQAGPPCQVAHLCSRRLPLPPVPRTERGAAGQGADAVCSPPGANGGCLRRRSSSPGADLNN